MHRFSPNHAKRIAILNHSGSALRDYFHNLTQDLTIAHLSIYTANSAPLVKHPASRQR